MHREQQRKNVTRCAVAAVFAVMIIGAWGCTKTSPAKYIAEAETHADKAFAPSFEQVRLLYKDSILFPRSSPKNYTVRPIKIPKEAGYFVPNPEGLIINPSTGAIEVNGSEAGISYKVYFMSADNQPLDSANIAIAGIDYEDGIFELTATPEHDKAVPVYKGTSIAFPCSTPISNDDIDSAENGVGQCSFDETDLNGDGSSDIEGANRNRLTVNKKNGAIDLEESFKNGVFGSLKPANGVFKDFTIYYRLDDASEKALNKITVRIYHFTSRDKIPVWLTEELRRRKENSENVVAPLTEGNVIQSNYILTRPKRPPLIIIVSGLTLTLA